MKRLTALMLCMIMVLGLFTACGAKAPAAETPAVTAPASDVAMQYITVDDAAAVLEDDSYIFFDVRKAADYTTSHIPGAEGHDMDAAKNGDFAAGVATMENAIKGLDKNIVVVCYSGKSYAQATFNVLSALGYDMSKVYTLEGGYKAWSEKHGDKVEVSAEIVAPAEDVAMQYITVEDAATKLEDETYVFFDVRKAADYTTSHIPGALGHDMDAAKEGDFAAGVATMQVATRNMKDENIVIICYSGKRYAQATTNVLSALGYDMTKVYTLEGGFTAWSEKFPGNVEPKAEPQLSGTMKVVATSEKYVTLFDKFTADTGVKVELLSMSSGEVLSKLRAEGGAPAADLWFGGGIDAFMAAKADGLLEQVNFAGAADLDPLYKDAENYWFSKGMTVVGFLVNNTLLNELKLEAPTCWADLVKAEYEGEVIMSNPAVSGTNYSVVNALLQTLGEEEGWKYFEGLNKNISMYGKRGADPLNKVLADEFAIGISYVDDTVFEAIGEMDISVVYPTDGMPWVPEGVAVFKNAENVEAAKYFIEWLYTNDSYLKELAELDGKDYIKLIKPSMEGIELTFDASIMMEEDLALFGTQREAILAKFETVMGEKSNTNE